YFGPRAGLVMALLAGLLYAAAAALAPPWVGWTAVIIVSGLVGLPAFALGHVAERERRARAEVERLNTELMGTLTRLQAAQEELLVAERMATVGRLALKVAHEVRNPIAAIELNAEMLGDIVRDRPGSEMEEASSLVGAIRDQVNTLDALTEEYLAFARFPRPHLEEDSTNEMAAGHGARALHLAPDRGGARRRAPVGERARVGRDLHRPPAGQAAGEGGVSESAGAAVAATLLVADDDPAVRQSLERMLTREGYA